MDAVKAEGGVGIGETSGGDGFAGGGDEAEAAVGPGLRRRDLNGVSLRGRGYLTSKAIGAKQSQQEKT